MARMHSRKKGKSGSHKPIKKTIPSWVSHDKKEIELLILKYGKEGKTASEIGMYLRDEYGIPYVKAITGKSITTILKEKELTKEVPEDMMALIKKSIQIRKHLEENHKDQTAKRGLKLTESKINRLAKYYKANKIIDSKWKYDPEKVKLIVN
jgi:small subunit ribosomal protein S15